ncbi:MAG TPA: rRNA maturation RNase YbeY [Roseiarcus sp.]|nr:rRNA maturation RNase YbeY [Roseiarcus sp.]
MARETIDACVAETGLQARDGAEVSLLLADDARLQSLNANWRGLDKATNVLSFPAASPERISDGRLLGDIAIAYETVEREAGSAGEALGDHYRRLVAHGFLHLIGYDHQTDEEAERMESLERRILARLGVRDPYGDEALAE